MYFFLKRSAPFLALLGLALGGCQPDLENDPKSSAGQADFARYIAVGNSLTAGFADGGLYLKVSKTLTPTSWPSNLPRWEEAPSRSLCS